MAELNPTYQTDRDLLQGQLNALPGAADAEIRGLDAKLTQANDNILQGARGRGLGFSGIPIQEQAQYAATDYAPAVARVRQSVNEKQTGILGSLNSLARQQRDQAENIFQADRQFDEQKRQFDLQMAEQRAAAARAAGGGYGGLDFGNLGVGGGGGATAPGAQATMSQNPKSGGFNFTVGGKAASFGQYVAAARQAGQNVNIRGLLSEMAKAGDGGAKAALGFVGNDGKYDPKKLNAQNAAIYNSLFWGLMPTASAPKAAAPQSTAAKLGYPDAARYFK